MTHNALKRILAGLALAGLYAAAFVGSWYMSVDQWYLPAGLRFAALFLLPRRWLPYALLGDALAMLYIRVPLANQKADDEYPLMWAYVSPFLLAMCLYISSRLIKRFVDTSNLPKTLPASALLFAVAGKGLNVGVNLSLSGPPFGTNLQQFVSAVIGDYLGILLIVLPIGVWQYRHQWFSPIRDVVKHSAAMLVLVLCLYAAVVVTGAHGTAVQLIPLIFMTLPAVYLTVLYGWNGAAVGCVIVNLGISLALPRTGIMGAFDGVVLLAQAALCVASIVLLGVGWHITRLSNQFKSAFAELTSTNEALSQSRNVARDALFSSENRLRQHALMLAAATSHLDGFRHHVVSTLKANGHSAAAFDATMKGRAAIDEIAKYGDELYPFDIEKYGLYAVLMSDNFANRWGPGVGIRHILDGESPKTLRMSQRLAVYRGICAAIDALHHQLHPHEIITKVRIWKRNHQVGTTVEIRYKGGNGELSRVTDLESIVSAYGGTLKYRRTRGVAFVLSDAEEAIEQPAPAPINLSSFQPAG
jgi:hypothetical protein